MQVSNESAKNIPADPCIDASRSSSLYQDNLTEIKVNALFGLNLIKAFYRITMAPFLICIPQMPDGPADFKT